MAAAHHCRDVNARPENLLRLLSRIVSVLLIYCCPRTDWGGRHDYVSERRCDLADPGAGRRAEVATAGAGSCACPRRLRRRVADRGRGRSYSGGCTRDGRRHSGRTGGAVRGSRERGGATGLGAGFARCRRRPCRLRQGRRRAPVDPRFAALPTQARFAKAGEPAVTGSLVPGGFAPAPRASEWRDEEFAQIQALDGRTLAASSVRIRLAGLELPGAGEVCRTLDGRLEPCLARAATQLELITRFRKVSCRYRIEAPGEASGSCRIGTTDLAERMARTGFAKRAPQARRLALAAAATGVN